MIKLSIGKDIPDCLHEIIKTVVDELNYNINEIPNINEMSPDTYNEVLVYKMEVPYDTPQEIGIKKDILCSAFKKALLIYLKSSDFKKNCSEFNVFLEENSILVGFRSQNEIIQQFEKQPKTVECPQLGKLYKKVMEVAHSLAEDLKYKANSGKGYGYQYTELEDFCSSLYQKANINGLGIKIEILTTGARLTLIDCDTGVTDTLTHPFHFIRNQLNTKENERNFNQQIQTEGALITYFRRYLLINTFGIALPDTVEEAVKEEALRRFNAISKTEEYKKFKSETEKIQQERGN